MKKRLALSFLWTAFTCAFPVVPAMEGSRPPADKPVFRIGVDTVFINVSVTDPLNRYVIGLEREHFKIYDERVEQDIVHFARESAPVSIAVVFDVSGSMKANGNIEKARSAISRFVSSANPVDEFCLVTFNQQAKLASPFGRDIGNLRSEIAFRQPGGHTALHDAVYMGLEQMKSARHAKKALILISDGEDNSSRYSFTEVKDFARESDVQIYAIGEEGKLGYGRSQIQNIVSLTGGRAFFPDSFNELDYYIDLVMAELRNQYIVGFTPDHKVKDGRWRRLRVKLEPPAGLPRLVVHARQGYFAPR